MPKHLKLSFRIVLLSIMAAPSTALSQSDSGTANAPSAKEVRDFLEAKIPESSQISRLAQSYFAQNTPQRDVPALAAQIIQEVFSHPDEIRDKVWDLQNVIYSRKQLRALTEEEIFKIKLLEGGLNQTLADERLQALLKDLGVIGATAGLIALASGMGLSPTVSLRKLGRRPIADRSAEISRSRRTPRAWFNEVILTKFHRASPGERLLHDLSLLGVHAQDIHLIQSRLLPITSHQASRLGVEKFYRTNRKKLSVAAVSPIDYTPKEFGYFVFQLKPSRFHTKDPVQYFKTARFTEDEMNRIVSTLFVGKDHRVFVEIVSEGGEIETRSTIHRGLRARARDFRTRTSEVVNKFNTERASRALVGTTGLLSGGYIMGGVDNWRFADVYVGSLLSGHQEVPAAASSPPENSVRQTDDPY